MVTMPTGEEPPKKFAEFAKYEENRKGLEGLRADHVLSSQLAPIEIAELRTFFEKHHESATSYAGATPRMEKDLHFEYGLHLTPIGRTATDMIVMRAYDNGELVGYSYVIYGWPRPEAWVIDYLLVDPLGTDEATAEDIASLMLDRLAGLIAHAGFDAAYLVAITGDESTDEFWTSRGFEEYTAGFAPHVEESLRRTYSLTIKSADAAS